MTSKIHQHSTLNRTPKVLDTRRVRTTRGVQSVKISQPAYQTVVQHNHLPSFFTQTFRSVPSNLFANNGSKFSTQLEAGSFTKLRSATLKITVTVNTSNAKLAPVPYWFDRIEIRSGSKHLGIIYNDQLMFNLGNLTGHQLENSLRSSNMNPDFSPLGRVHVTIPAGRQETFYLPLVNTFINNSELYMKQLESDLTLDFFPSADIRISGNGTITCDDLQLICQTESLSPEDEKTHDMFHKSVITSNRYLDVVPVNFYNESLTAGVQKKLELDSVHGKVVGILTVIKNTGATNSNNGNFDYISLGDGSTIDILDSGSKSVLGNGTPIDTTLLRNQIWPSHFSNDYNQQKHFYWLPFTDNTVASFAGKQGGYLQMDGDRNYLALTPSQGGVQEVQTINTTEIATSGWFRLRFQDEITYPLPYNATESDIKTALELMRGVRFHNPNPLTITVVGTLDTGTSLQFTFGQYENLQGKQIQMVSESLAGVNPIKGTEIITTQGKSGFFTGTYDISLYAMVQSKVFQDTAGRLTVEQE